MINSSDVAMRNNSAPPTRLNLSSKSTDNTCNPSISLSPNDFFIKLFKNS